MINPYKAPESVVDSTSELSRYNELEAFVKGSKSLGDAESYLIKWQGLNKNTSSWAGFNFPSFFFGFIWCFYRKMYITGIVVILLELFCGFLTELTFLLLNSDSISSPAILFYTIPFLFVRLPLGFLANKLYFNYAKKTISRIKQTEPENTILDKIREKGGPSILGLILGFVINIAFRMI